MRGGTKRMGRTNTTNNVLAFHTVSILTLITFFILARFRTSKFLIRFYIHKARRGREKALAI